MEAQIEAHENGHQALSTFQTNSRSLPFIPPKDVLAYPLQLALPPYIVRGSRSIKAIDSDSFSYTSVIELFKVATVVLVYVVNRVHSLTYHLHPLLHLFRPIPRSCCVVHYQQAYLLLWDD